MVANTRNSAPIRANRGNRREVMSKRLFAAVLVSGLIAATPFNANAQTTTTTPAAAPAAAPAPAATKKKIASASQIALRERQRKCGAEWKLAKAGGKIEKGMKWPQFWSACNKRLKGGG